MDATERAPADVGDDLPDETRVVLGDVSRERLRQDFAIGRQDHPDGTGGAMEQITVEAVRRATQRATDRGELTWRNILAEQVYEAFAEQSWDMLRADLVQVAAVAVAWVEDIDRRIAGSQP